MDVPEVTLEKSSFRSGLFRFGVGASLLWLACGIGTMVFLADSPTAPKPNEWGDIFAGLFAPVAFLWLVLGYLQQGKELQLSTQALRLQVEELKNSVEQQKELVKAARDQLEAAQRERDRLSAQEYEATQPRLVLQPLGTRVYSDTRTLGFGIANEGEGVTNLRVTVTPPPTTGADNHYFSLPRNYSHQFTVFYDQQVPDQMMFNVTFIDVNMREGRDRFVANVIRNKTEPNSLRVERQQTDRDATLAHRVAPLHSSH